MNTPDTSKRFLITGVSSGFGRAIAEAALAAGHRVVGTLRQEAERTAFEALAPGRSHAVLLDVSDFATVRPTVDRIEGEIGPLDVLVNNAGYGHEGLIEESSLQDLIRQFGVNVFGAIAVAKAVLPFMRERRRGHIVNITSMGGNCHLPRTGLLPWQQVCFGRSIRGLGQGDEASGYPRDCRGAGSLANELGGTVDGASAAIHS